LHQVILSKFQLFVHNYSDIRIHVYSFLFSILIIRVVKKAYTVFRVYYPRTNFSWTRKTSALRVLEIYNNLFLTLII